jgi:hypothetical protein
VKNVTAKTEGECLAEELFDLAKRRSAPGLERPPVEDGFVIETRSRVTSACARRNLDDTPTHGTSQCSSRQDRSFRMPPNYARYWDLHVTASDSGLRPTVKDVVCGTGTHDPSLVEQNDLKLRALYRQCGLSQLGYPNPKKARCLALRCSSLRRVLTAELAPANRQCPCI